VPPPTTTTTSKPFSQASWGRLDMKPNRKKRPKHSIGFHIHRNGCFFLRWLAKPITTLLLYQGLGPAIPKRHRRSWCHHLLTLANMHVNKGGESVGGTWQMKNLMQQLYSTTYL
jgi:Cu/Zn superoxide dismutase